jgi:hypothetical protein
MTDVLLPLATSAVPVVPAVPAAAAAAVAALAALSAMRKKPTAAAAPAAAVVPAVAHKPAAAAAAAATSSSTVVPPKKPAVAAAAAAAPQKPSPPRSIKRERLEPADDQPLSKRFKADPAASTGGGGGGGDDRAKLKQELLKQLEAIRPSLPALATYDKDRHALFKRVASAERELDALKVQLADAIKVIKTLQQPKPVAAAAAAASSASSADGEDGPICISWRQNPQLKAAIEQLAGSTSDETKLDSALRQVDYVKMGDKATLYNNRRGQTVVNDCCRGKLKRVKIVDPGRGWVSHLINRVRVTAERIQSSLDAAHRLLAMRKIGADSALQVPVAASAAGAGAVTTAVSSSPAKKPAAAALAAPTKPHEIELSMKGLQAFLAAPQNADSPFKPFVASAVNWINSEGGWQAGTEPPLPVDEDGDGYAEMFQGVDGDVNYDSLLTHALMGSDPKRETLANAVAYRALWPMYMRMSKEAKSTTKALKALRRYCKEHRISADLP